MFVSVQGIVLEIPVYLLFKQMIDRSIMNIVLAHFCVASELWQLMNVKIGLYKLFFPHLNYCTVYLINQVVLGSIFRFLNHSNWLNKVCYNIQREAHSSIVSCEGRCV